MDIKSVFEITKADRYTQDGRDQIAKIQETEDKTYQIGEISQKTGLQKTANGWVPPKETKYGKVTEKNGQVGVQQKLGKGSKFEAFKNESAAKKALANYTAGYNTTERSKQDPHSDQARLMKHLDKETEQMARENKKKSAAYMDEQGLHDIYMDIKNNELEDYTVEEIAKEYRITKGDAEVIKNRIENNKRAKKQDKQDRKDQTAAVTDPQLAKEIANSNHFEEQKKAAAKAKQEAELKQQRAEGEANAEAYRKRYEAEHGPNPGAGSKLSDKTTVSEFDDWGNQKQNRVNEADDVFINLITNKMEDGLALTSAIESVEAKVKPKYKKDWMDLKQRINNSMAPAAGSATPGQNKLAEIAKISGNYKPENLYAVATPKGNIEIVERQPGKPQHSIMIVDPDAYHVDTASLDEEGIFDRPANDSAPLTGDTKIKVRK